MCQRLNVETKPMLINALLESIIWEEDSEVEVAKGGHCSSARPEDFTSVASSALRVPPKGLAVTKGKEIPGAGGLLSLWSVRELDFDFSYSHGALKDPTGQFIVFYSSPPICIETGRKIQFLVKTYSEPAGEGLSKARVEIEDKSKGVPSVLDNGSVRLDITAPVAGGIGGHRAFGQELKVLQQFVVKIKLRPGERVHGIFKVYYR